MKITVTGYKPSPSTGERVISGRGEFDAYALAIEFHGLLVNDGCVVVEWEMEE